MHPLRHIHRKPVVEPAGEHLAGSVQLVKFVDSRLCGHAEIDDHLVGGERRVRHRIAVHTPAHIPLVEVIPERALGELGRDRIDHAAVEHRRHVIGTEQAFQHLRIHRQQLRIAFGLWHIVLVHDRPHKPEQQMLGHRRGRGRLGTAHFDEPRLHAGQHLTQCGHVVDILQAFARGFQ